MNHRLKVLYMTNIPAPYRVDFFNELGKYCDLTVLYEREKACDRETSWVKNDDTFYEKIQLRGFLIGSDSSVSVGAVNHLKKNHYDVIVVGGYSTPTAMLTILYLKNKKIPFFLNADGGLVKKERKIVKWIKTFFISSATGYLSTGAETNRYLEYYGAKREDIYCYPFSSVKDYMILGKVLTTEEKGQLKKKNQIEYDKIIISVGQFIHRKGFDVLIKSMKNIKDAVLYIIGGNPTNEYIWLMKENGIENVFFLPFMEQKELFLYYRMADIFVLPTREDVWGLVINEAMTQGLPIVTTERCVAGTELVQNNENGFLVPIENTEELSEKINIILQDDILRKKMSAKSLEVIRKYSIETMAQKHIEIFESIEVRNESFTDK